MAALAKLGKDIITSQIEYRGDNTRLNDLVEKLVRVDWEKRDDNDWMRGEAGFAGQKDLYPSTKEYAASASSAGWVLFASSAARWLTTTALHEGRQPRQRAAAHRLPRKASRVVTSAAFPQSPNIVLSDCDRAAWVG